MLFLLAGLGFFFFRRAKARKAIALADVNREVSRETFAHLLTISHPAIELV